MAYSLADIRYGAHDDNNNDTHSFKFYFNICGALSDGFPGSDNCDLGVNDNTAAVRVDQDGSCHKLGEYGRHGSKLLAYEIELHGMSNDDGENEIKLAQRIEQ